jgi:hypothetical protein
MDFIEELVRKGDQFGMAHLIWYQLMVYHVDQQLEDIQGSENPDVAAVYITLTEQEEDTGD